MTPEQVIQEKYEALKDALNERARRLWAATEAQAVGRGGVPLVAKATNISRSTIQRGLKELRSGPPLKAGRVRRPGAGRKRATTLDQGLRSALEELVEPTSRGDPQSPLRWTCKSTRRLAEELTNREHPASDWLVRQLLYEMGYSLQGNQKIKEGTSHPDRDAQFRHINQKLRSWIRRRSPAISVDTKKKELVGDFKNVGREWRPRGKPEPVRVHDFIDKEKGKAIPYGVYDIAQNLGWVSVGVDHDTAEFAVNTIRTWWQKMGKRICPKAKSLLIVADSGGSNGSRTRLWKWELQKLANQTGMIMHVCHFPPGTSKWNQIEHRLFSFISQNWRGKPLITHATIVNLIANTRTSTGLTIRCVLDERPYPSLVEVSNEELASIRLLPDSFHGDWNYEIRPNRK